MIEGGKFNLLDGDKIATLAAAFIIEKIRQANIQLDDGTSLNVGVVQTAYANGSATVYVKDVLVIISLIIERASRVYCNWR
jgi:phosphoacetylglucosamine mutase